MNTAVNITAIIAAVVVINIIAITIRDIVKDRAAARYPHPDGDYTVLGPEIFASKDATVICWKGENYVRQTQEGQAE